MLPHSLIIMNFYRLFFSEAITTSHIPIETILPEECAFIIEFSCTVWTVFGCSLSDGVLADDVLIPPNTPISGRYELSKKKKVRKLCSNTKTIYEMKKGDVGIAKHFSKKVRKQGMTFQKLCQDVCQCLMLHPYITASRTNS